MKMRIKKFSIILVAIVCFLSTTLVSAAGNGDTKGDTLQDRLRLMDQTCISLLVLGEGYGSGSGGSSTVGSGTMDGSESDGSQSNSSVNNAAGNGDALRDQIRLMDQTCTTLKADLSEISRNYIELENQYQEALRQQNESEAQQLREQLQTMEQERIDCVDQLNQVRLQMRETIQASYSEEEMAGIRAVEMEMKQKYPEDLILPVENIIPIGFTVKFDTPPVVREGRTLVPVRALTEGMGADVSWNAVDGTIVIEKDGFIMQLQLRNSIAYVNGEEVAIDVTPEIINNRTVVPLRFILQHFGYDVDWNTESGLIEITAPV